MLMAGACSVDISPNRGVELAGYPHFPRHNQGVHDPLIASCLYLSDGAVELVIVTLDLLFFSKRYVAQVRRSASERTGIPGANMLICCSHTHSGPWAAGRLDLEALTGSAPDVDASYVDELVEKIVEIIARAKQTRFQASLGVGSGRCGAEQGVGGNRRIIGGACDASVGVIAVKDVEGVLRYALVNYALHPTFIHEDSALVTADYPFYIRNAVHGTHPRAVFGFAQGASGDQSSRFFRRGQSYDEAERVGRAIAGEALSLLNALRFDGQPTLAIASASLPLSLREFRPIPELAREVALAEAEYKRLLSDSAPYLEVQHANLRLLGAEDILSYATLMERGAPIAILEDEGPAEVMALRLGHAAIVCLPGEIFVRFALDIKKSAPLTTTLVFTLSNGCLPGYCYTPEALEQGGYEVDTSMLTGEFGEALSRLAAETLERL